MTSSTDFGGDWLSCWSWIGGLLIPATHAKKTGFPRVTNVGPVLWYHLEESVAFSLHCSHTTSGVLIFYMPEITIIMLIRVQLKKNLYSMPPTSLVVNTVHYRTGECIYIILHYAMCSFRHCVLPIHYTAICKNLSWLLQQRVNRYGHYWCKHVDDSHPAVKIMAHSTHNLWWWCLPAHIEMYTSR